MFNCFDDDFASMPMDQAPAKFKHKLAGHPALSLEHLSRMVLAHTKDKVHYAKGLMKNGDDFEQMGVQQSNGMTLEQTVETIRTSNSYMYVMWPETTDATFKELHRALLADVETVMRARGLGRQAIEPSLHLFIASPNAHTPFHIDRYSTILMQARGRKEVCIFPSWDERVVSSANREAYLTYHNTKLPWNDDVDPLARRFDFAPGESVHIPFVAGHYVQNGSEDVSISLSIIFNTAQSIAWRRTIAFNRMLRPRLGRLGLAPSPVGASPWLDNAKAGLWAASARVGRAIKRRPA